MPAPSRIDPIHQITPCSLDWSGHERQVINHTDCGLMHSTEQELRTRIQNRTGTAAVAPAFFYAFQNIEENVRHQLQKLRTHPWIPKEVAVRGFVYDVVSGRIREIKD